MNTSQETAKTMFVRHYDEILHHVTSILSTCPETPYEAGDIMSEMFIKCHDKARMIPVHGKDDFIRFMKVVAKNLILHVIDREGRHDNGMECNDRTMVIADTPKEGPFELRHSIASMLMTIPKKQRTALYFYASGYDYKEIAQIMSIPMGSVKSRIHHARLAVMSGEWKDLRYASA